MSFCNKQLICLLYSTKNSRILSRDSTYQRESTSTFAAGPSIIANFMLIIVINHYRHLYHHHHHRYHYHTPPLSHYHYYINTISSLSWEYDLSNGLFKCACSSPPGFNWYVFSFIGCVESYKESRCWYCRYQARLLDQDLYSSAIQSSWELPGTV